MDATEPYASPTVESFEGQPGEAVAAEVLPAPANLWKQLGFTIWSITAAFGVYFCMYAFRKPFTVGKFEGLDLLGIQYKTVLVTSQVLGYTISKFVGIKIIAEMTAGRRAITLLALIGIAELALLGFAVVPTPYNFVFLFINGLPLGMVFGLVLGFLEGRRLTEALTAGLCASFILADGVMKYVGSRVLEYGVSEVWMPCTVGLLFAVPLVVGTWMLSLIPPPEQRDVVARSSRTPMTRDERLAFFYRYGPGLVALVAAYLFITILRSIRSDYAPEIWQSLGFEKQPTVYATSEMWVALGVMGSSVLSIMIYNNRVAFFVSMGISVAGLLLVLAASLLRAFGGCDPFVFMVLFGLGLYLPYVATHTTIFERLLAMTRDRGNIGYLMYLADAWGYLGYVAVMVSKNLLSNTADFMEFFDPVLWTVTILALVCMMLSWGYFAWRIPATSPAGPLAADTV